MRQEAPIEISGVEKEVKKMKNRSIILAVSVLCVGIMIMPYTVSLFGTQHDWVDATTVDCATCHTDIVIPSVALEMHETLTGASDQDYCKSCHQISAAGTSLGVTGDGGFDDEHAAVTVECLDCHGQTGAATGPDVYFDAGDSGGAYINIATEGHSAFVGNLTALQGAWTATELAGNNEACISCHTTITINPTFTYGATSMDIVAVEDNAGDWTVTFTPQP